jgi:hypothetical protein
VLDDEIAKLEETVKTVNDNKFERCFEAVPETFRGKESGNMILNDNCKFCDFRFSCFDIDEQPSKVSQAKTLPIVAYVR